MMSDPRCSGPPEPIARAHSAVLILIVRCVRSASPNDKAAEPRAHARSDLDDVRVMSSARPPCYMRRDDAYRVAVANVTRCLASPPGISKMSGNFSLPTAEQPLLAAPYAGAMLTLRP